MSTKIECLKSEYLDLQRRYRDVDADWRMQGKRADSAEAEAAEWKLRFDALARRDNAVGDAFVAAIANHAKPQSTLLADGSPGDIIDTKP